MMKKNRQNNQGFTLMETVVGVGLFALALFFSLQTMSFSLEFGQSSGDRMTAINETRRVLEQMRRAADVNGLASVANTAWTTGNALPGQNVVVTYPQGAGLNPLPVRVSMNWTEKGKAISHTIDTLITDRQ